MTDHRYVKTPDEFHHLMKVLYWKFRLRHTSGYRPDDPPPHKHRYRIGDDSQFRTYDIAGTETPLEIALPEDHPSVIEVVRFAREDLGLWALYHDSGSGLHFHTQGAPPGPIDWEWLYLWNGGRE